MALDMFLDDLAEQAVERAAATGDDMHHLLAPRLGLECALDGVDLSADAAHPIQELGFLANGVAHPPIIAYPPIPPGDRRMHPFLTSTALVALAEIGDKTQLLSLLLAARYRAPVPIVLGILVATLANHGIAAGVGDMLARVLEPSILNWAVVLSFVAMGLWILVPDKLDEEDLSKRSARGIFLTTALSFFLAEMGDKTQVATVALAARFSAWIPVVAGTTLGMLLANVPAVLFGHRFADRLPSRWIHAVAAVMFIVLGALALRTALLTR